MADNTNLKGIDTVIAEYKAKHGEFKPGKVYGIKYLNGYGKKCMCDAPVPDDCGDPEKDIRGTWEEYVQADEQGEWWEHDDELEAIDRAVEIIGTYDYREWMSEVRILMEMAGD